jgi:hypothetical protein
LFAEQYVKINRHIPAKMNKLGPPRGGTVSGLRAGWTGKESMSYRDINKKTVYDIKRKLD